MHRALFTFLILPLMLALTLAAGCSSGRTSTADSSGESAEAPETVETAAMDTTTTDKAAPQDCTYTTTPLTDATQVQINCSNGTGFVVRQRADGKWEQEARAVAGARPTYASVEQAAKALCCR